MHEKLRNTKNAHLLLAMCFCVYTALYVGRYCLSACIGNMVSAGLYTKTGLGTVASCFFVSYALMQIPSGFLGDRLRASTLAGTGIGGAAVITLVFPFVDNINLMAILWAVNGVLQALVWPALMHIVSDVNAYSGESEKPLISVVVLSVSVPTGILASYGLCALLLRFSSYRVCFLTAGIIMAAVTFVWFFCAVPMLCVESGAAAEAGKTNPDRNRVLWKNLFGTVLPVLLLVSFIHGLLKDGLTTWIPTYLTETLKLSTEKSLLLTTLMPIVNFGGVYLAHWVNSKLFRSEMKSSSFCFGMTFMSICLMMLAFSDSAAGTVICFAGVTCLMTAVNVLVISIIPMHFSKLSVVSSVTGILDAAIYLGSAVSSALFAFFAENYGWAGTRVLWCACAVLGIAVSMAGSKAWEKFRSSKY